MYSDLTKKNSSAVGCRMRKWYNVLATMYWQCYAVMHYSFRLISGKISQSERLCADILRSFKIPLWSSKPELKKALLTWSAFILCSTLVQSEPPIRKLFFPALLETSWIKEISTMWNKKLSWIWETLYMYTNIKIAKFRKELCQLVSEIGILTSKPVRVYMDAVKIEPSAKRCNPPIRRNYTGSCVIQT